MAMPNRTTPVPNATGSNTANGCMIESTKTAKGCMIDSIKTANGCVIAETMPESMAILLCDNRVADAAARIKTACDALAMAEAIAILLTDDSIAEAIAETIAILLSDCGGV